MRYPARILLVEDNEGDAELFREMLKSSGVEHELMVLEDGEKARAFFEGGGCPDLVVLDLKLPRVSGHQLMRFLQETGRCDDLPVIVLTGSDSPSDKEEARRNGALCYLVKPMTVTEMDRTAERFREILLGEADRGCTVSD